MGPKAQRGEVLPLVLIVVAVLLFIWGGTRDGVAILVVILVVATVEAVSEWRSSRALDALRGLSAPQARVRRDGVTADVPTEEVVPGDVLVLDAGAIVAADARVLTAAGLSAVAPHRGLGRTAVGRCLAFRQSPRRQSARRRSHWAPVWCWNSLVAAPIVGKK